MKTWLDSFIAVDVETTGMLDGARIVEVGFAWFEDRRLARKFSTLVNPGDIDYTAPDVSEAMKLNGIRPEELQGAPTFDQLLRNFFPKFGREPWAGHNLMFDLRMFTQEKTRLARRTGLNWDAFVPRPRLKLDTMLLAHWLDKTLPHYNLKAVAEAYGVTMDGHHRSMPDAKACGETLIAMSDHLPLDDEAITQIHEQAREQWNERYK